MAPAALVVLALRGFFLIGWVCVLLFCSGAAPEKKRPQFTITYLKAAYQLVLVNPEPAPYTVTLHFVPFENVRIDCDNPCTLVLPPFSRQVLSLAKKEPLHPWHFRYRYRYQRGDFRAVVERKHIYELPYASGANYRMGQAYNGDFTHQGPGRFALDFSLPEGTPVHAARAGQVIWTEERFSEGGIEDRFKGKDNRVEIMHNDGSIALYGHLKYRGVLVQPGQKVAVGQILGYSGSTGYSGGPHLHFQVHRVLSGEERTTVPTLFRTAAGLQILKSGQSYLRP